MLCLVENRISLARDKSTTRLLSLLVHLCGTHNNQSVTFTVCWLTYLCVLPYSVQIPSNTTFVVGDRL